MGALRGLATSIIDRQQSMRAPAGSVGGIVGPGASQGFKKQVTISGERNPEWFGLQVQRQRQRLPDLQSAVAKVLAGVKPEDSMTFTAPSAGDRFTIQGGGNTGNSKFG